MPLDPTAAANCAQQIVSDLGLEGDQATQATERWTTVLTDIFAAIVANATVTVAVASVSGITPGGGVSGPGAGTGTIA